MERSIQLQLRLQSLAQGLLVIAVAYYLVGLITYSTKARRHFYAAGKATA